MDMSLDDIIKMNKPAAGRGGSAREPQDNKGQRKGRHFKKGAVRGGFPRRGGRISDHHTQGGMNGAWRYDDRTARAVAHAEMGPTTLTISNLDIGVSDNDIRELFAEFGYLNAAVHYDRSGRSMGTAEVIFERRGDAVRAMNQYNGVPLDGSAMKIHLTTNELPAPPRRPMAARVSVQSRDRKFRSSRGAPKNWPNKGRRDGNQTGQQRRQVSSEELDAELDAYIKERNSS